MELKKGRDGTLNFIVELLLTPLSMFTKHLFYQRYSMVCKIFYVPTLDVQVLDNFHDSSHNFFFRRDAPALVDHFGYCIIKSKKYKGWSKLKM